MIDPIVSLAFSIHSNPGVYALLLGSGVSRTASIPTGWEIVLDLIYKLAHLDGVEHVTDPVEWYRKKFGREPDYSEILESIAPSQEERQRLLRSFIEPTEKDRESGLKVPTAAHRAIAELCVSGKIRAVVTTNFDRLLERAIEDLGTTPIVLSSADSINGALPLVHQQCCIVKVHGDYLDTRIRNTAGELKEYEDSVERLLDQVFDEFGGLVCGWSATWDPALCAAIERAPNRRFTFYWTARGDLPEAASRLVKNRSGTVIQIKSADQFFSDLAEKVKSLEEWDQPHPLSVKSASTSVKRFLSEDRYRIELHDLVKDETDRVHDAFQADCDSFRKSRTAREEAFASFLKRTSLRIEILSEICIQGGCWASAGSTKEFVYPIERLAYDPNRGQSGHHLKLEFRAIPSILLMYLSGIAALANGNLSVLTALLSLPTVDDPNECKPLLSTLDWRQFQMAFKGLPGRERQKVAASEWLYERCKERLVGTITNEISLERLFDRFEIIRSVFYGELDSGGAYSNETDDLDNGLWGPPGRFIYRMNNWDTDSKSNEFSSLLADDELHKSLVTPGIFDGDPDRFKIALRKFLIVAKKMAAQHY